MDAYTTSDMTFDKTQDIGHFDEPVLVCGGAYSNFEALCALMDAALAHGIPAARVIHTGDAVAYCADPAATSLLLRDSGAHCIQGNVEESLSASLPDCGCGFDEESLCNRLAAEWFAFADARIDDSLRRWMAAMPAHLTFEMCGARVRVVHGAVTSINRFMFASLPGHDFEEEVRTADADMVVAGHSGIAFTRRVGNRLWHNSGSLGMPANDGTPRAWYSILHPEPAGIRIRHYALHYDHEKAAAKMRAEGICGQYADALVSGLWPSLDILPGHERAATGQPLDLEREVTWKRAAATV